MIKSYMQKVCFDYKTVLNAFFFTPTFVPVAP